MGRGGCVGRGGCGKRRVCRERSVYGKMDGSVEMGGSVGRWVGVEMGECTYVGRQVHGGFIHWNKTPGEGGEGGEG